MTTEIYIFGANRILVRLQWDFGSKTGFLHNSSCIHEVLLVDYILGDNPRATSYMVGYGNNYPQQVLLLVDPTLIYDNFADQRDNYEQTKSATYNNAPLLGILARLHSGHSGYNQLLPVTFPAPKTQPKLAPVTGTTPSQVSSSAPIAIEQKMTSSWDYNGKTYYRYSTTVTNKSPKTLKFLNLSISKLYGPLWGLTKSGDSYVFPAWLNSLTAGKSLEFAYIHSASQANVSVSSYNLA
ncbi:endoglucanase 6-like [Camellia sinensis]|uniref:endoglucanase 6-like n=1 Tax=Camellia sinensis TaxID=4442 RepID=UPI0010362918|nr:endoglucanase 6-like [Camellia sinensis]